jgi:hypothetical protein
VSADPRAYDPPRLEAHVVPVAADAVGNAKSPAHVALFLQRGSLRVTGGASHHLVEGTARGAVGDPAPRVDVGADRISITQASVGGASPKGDATFELTLGGVPLALLVETGSGQSQSIDLGGVFLTAARVHTAAGHVVLDWTRPNAPVGGRLEVATETGSVEVTHLGRFGGGTVEVRERAGLVSLDFGDRVEHDFTVDADVAMGKLILRLPKTVTAHAEVTAAASEITIKGWRFDGYGFVLGDASAGTSRVALRVRVGSGQVELGAF